MRAAEIPGFDQMTGPEKILLVEEIRESLAGDEAGVPVPDSHIRELDRRMGRHRAEPGELLSLEELQRRLGK